MLPALNLSHSLVAVHALTNPSVTWLEPQRSAIVALDTPGYPFWLMDKANAPALYRNAEGSYWETHRASAVLLNLSMTADNTTLLVNGKAILPFEDYNIPPTITAYQAPANITERKVRSLAEMGLLRGDWEQLTLSYRSLELDYDRLVWADPARGPWQHHVPTLRFRIMGIGAHSRNDVLDTRRQKVLHVTLTEWSHGAYAITNVEIKSLDESYGYVHPGPTTAPKKCPDMGYGPSTCSLRSWRCPDEGLYEADAPPYYRFIWRNRFDEFGRIGSLRHAVVRKLSVLREVWEDAGPAMLLSFGILLGLACLAMAGAAAWRRVGGRRERRVRDLAEDDSLLGDYVAEKYADEADEDEDEDEDGGRLIDVASDAGQ